MMVLLLQACASQQSPVVQSRDQVLSSRVESMTDTLMRSAAQDYRFEEQSARLRNDNYQAAPERRALTCANSTHSSFKGLPKISVDFFEMDLREALLEISILSGFPIIADESVGGLISVSLVDVNPEQALNTVLAAGDFSYRKFDGYLLVGASTPDAPSFAKLASTCRYKPAHMAPLDLAATLSPYFQQFVRVPQQADYLTITAPRKVQRQIQESLKVFDQAPAQVLLEMSVVEVSREALDILGVAWDQVARSRSGVATGGYAQSSGAQISSGYGLSGWAGSAVRQVTSGGFFYGLMPRNTLASSVHALQASGEATVKAMPSIVSIDGEEANFNSTQTVWLPYAGLNTGAKDRRQLSYGVEMNVLPRIAADGMVTLRIINATVSDLTENQAGEPRLVSHSISSTVNIQDGDYLILGGLLQKRLNKGTSGLPVSSSSKAGRFLTGKQQAEEEEMEVLIMIRPKILHG